MKVMKPEDHEVGVRKSPINHIVHCTCGWSRSVPRQNALARAAKVKRLIREHEEEVERRFNASLRNQG